MEELNFPNCIVKLKNRKNKTYLFDKIRKKWVLATPEEWVRIHCLIYFTDTLGYPTSWIKVENEIKLYNKLSILNSISDYTFEHNNELNRLERSINNAPSIFFIS